MLKKNIFRTSLLFLLSIGLLSGCAEKTAETSAPVYKRTEVSSAEDSLKLLKEGNERVVSGKVLNKDLSTEIRENLSTNGQKPFAVVLSCSDSRIPPEIVFDQGVGDIFVIRNAGNIIEPAALGSIEYGTYKLNAPLVVVLGHEQCGAVDATIKGQATNTDIDYIMEKIQPVFAKTKNPSLSESELITKTEDENIKHQVSKVKESKTIKKLISENKVQIVGAKYDLNTGKVTFLH